MKIDATQTNPNAIWGVDRSKERIEKSFGSFLQDAEAAESKEKMSAAEGVGKHGLMGWVELERRREAQKYVMPDILSKWGMKSVADIDQLSEADRARFDRDLEEGIDEFLKGGDYAEALLEETRKKAAGVASDGPPVV